MLPSGVKRALPMEPVRNVICLIFRRCGVRAVLAPATNPSQAIAQRGARQRRPTRIETRLGCVGLRYDSLSARLSTGRKLGQGFQIKCEITCRLETLSRLLFQAMPDNPVQSGRNIARRLGKFGQLLLSGWRSWCRRRVSPWKARLPEIIS